MALERRNPLPPGLYWVDVHGDDKIHAFNKWVKQDSIRVRKVRATEDPTGQWPSGNWYLFEVLAPTQWDGPGLPTIAENLDLEAEDTVQRPAPEEPLEWSLPSPGKALAVAGGVALAAGIGYVLLTRRR